MIKESDNRGLGREESHLRAIRFASKSGELALGNARISRVDILPPSQTAQGGFVRYDIDKDGDLSVNFVEEAPK